MHQSDIEALEQEADIHGSVQVDWTVGPPRISSGSSRSPAPEGPGPAPPPARPGARASRELEWCTVLRLSVARPPSALQRSHRLTPGLYPGLAWYIRRTWRAAIRRQHAFQGSDASTWAALEEEEAIQLCIAKVYFCCALRVRRNEDAGIESALVGAGLKFRRVCWRTKPS